jgi:hypothetical protein
VWTHQPRADRPPRVEIMTGLTRDQVDDLVQQLRTRGLWAINRRRALDPHHSVLVVLLYLRHNLSQQLIAALFGCSQPTVSRTITLLIPILTDLLAPSADRVAERELRSTVRVDGFLVPIGDRRANTYKSGMYSGKRHRCGFNVQVVASWRGRLVLTGDPMPGAMHDARAWRESGLAQRFHGRLHADGGPGGFADTASTPSPTSPPSCSVTADSPKSPTETPSYVRKYVPDQRNGVELLAAFGASVCTPPSDECLLDPDPPLWVDQ